MKQDCLRNRAEGWPGVTRFKRVPAHESHHMSPVNKSVQPCVYAHTPVLVALVSRKIFSVCCPNVFIASLYLFVLTTKLPCELESFGFSPVFTSLCVYRQRSLPTSTAVSLGTASPQRSRPLLWAPRSSRFAPVKKKTTTTKICTPTRGIQDLRWCLTSALVNGTHTLPASLKIFSSMYL